MHFSWIAKEPSGLGGMRVPLGRCARFNEGSAQCQGVGSGLGQWMASLYEDSHGNLWASAETGLWHWRPGRPTVQAMPNPVIGDAQTMSESDDGTPADRHAGRNQPGRRRKGPLVSASRHRVPIQPRSLLRDS